MPDDTSLSLSNIRLPGRPAEECTVLLVDDDAMIVGFLKDILANDGYQLLLAHSGAEALSAISKNNPDVVVMDVNMPGLDGIEVCRKAKEDETTRFTPIILVTGETDQTRKLEGLHAGADDFLNKPVDPLELSVRVRSLLRTRQLYEAVENNRRELEIRVAERTHELKEAYEKLQSLSRMKGNVLAIISHELRTPLHQARQAADVLRSSKLDDNQQAEIMKTLFARINLLEYRIRDVEIFSNPEAYELSPTSVSSLVNGAVEQARVLHNRREAAVTVTMPSNLPAVLVHPMSMTRALAHIIHNAIKFGEDRPAEVTVSDKDQKVTITIRDHGVGIPDSYKPHLFQPLTSADPTSRRKFPGMGIGLALVKVTLDSQNAEIHIDSTEGEGTTVAVTLPKLDLTAKENHPDSN